MSKRCLPLLGMLVFTASAALAQPVQVTYVGGLVSISCQNATLASVFEQLEKVAGVELILEDPVKSKRLTAELSNVPLAMGVQRLLEGNGVNYAVIMDPRDWGRVDKIFVGTGGGGPARAAGPVMQRPVVEPPEPVEEAYDDYDGTMEDFDQMDPADQFDQMDPMDDMQNMDDFANPGDDLVEDPNAFDDGSGEFAPPGSSPVPSYLPQQQAFPRSNFTPGLPNQNPSPQRTNPQPQDDEPPPPATMPFMDALGRPIPVPPDMNQQQRQRRQQQQER